MASSTSVVVSGKCVHNTIISIQAHRDSSRVIVF